MNKPSVLTIRVPNELKKRISFMAEKQGVSINQLAMYIFTKEVGNLEAGESIAEYWKNYSKDKILSEFDEVMRKVKNKPVPKWDKI